MWSLVWTVSLLFWSCEAAVTCRDENNGVVDWYILYKEPIGVTYTYIDHRGQRSGNKPISDPHGILAYTLSPLFQNMAPDFGFISYNDQHRATQHTESQLHLNFTELLGAQDDGHSKGVVMVERDRSGLWLLHSTPNFPLNRKQNDFWPTTGTPNGQTFICVTFSYDQFQKIGEHLQYIGAKVFDKHVPDNFHQELRDAANGVKKLPVTSLVELTSARGKTFHCIAKRMGGLPKNGDLYVSISEQIQRSLYVQTWGGQVGRVASYCSGTYKVLNIDNITTGVGSWRPASDHSKWCVSTDQNTPWTCIADVNRAKTQFRRRGGALCVRDADIHEIFTNFIYEYEDCKKKLMEMIYSVAEQSFSLMKLMLRVFA